MPNTINSSITLLWPQARMNHEPCCWHLGPQLSASRAKVLPSGSWNQAIRPPPARGVIPSTSVRTRRSAANSTPAAEARQQSGRGRRRTRSPALLGLPGGDRLIHVQRRTATRTVDTRPRRFGARTGASAEAELALVERDGLVDVGHCIEALSGYMLKAMIDTLTTREPDRLQHRPWGCVSEFA